MRAIMYDVLVEHECTITVVGAVCISNLSRPYG